MSNETDVHESVNPSDVFRAYTGLPKTHIDKQKEPVKLPEVKLEESNSKDEAKSKDDESKDEAKSKDDESKPKK